MSKEKIPASPFDRESYKSHRKWGRRIPPALSFSGWTDYDNPDGKLNWDSRHCRMVPSLDAGHLDRDKMDFIYKEWVAAGTPGIDKIISSAFDDYPSHNVVWEPGWLHDNNKPGLLGRIAIGIQTFVNRTNSQ